MALARPQTTTEQKESFPTEWAMFAEDQQNREQATRQLEDDRPGRQDALSTTDAAGRPALRQTVKPWRLGGAA